MPTVDEVQRLQREVEALKEEAARTRGTLDEMLKEAGPGDLTARLAAVEREIAKEEKKCERLLKEYREKYDDAGD